MRRTWKHYAAQAAGVTVVPSALYVVLVLYVGPPAFIAGLMAAWGVSRLRALAAARKIERRSGVILSVRLQRSVWRRRTPAYYATPRPA